MATITAATSGGRGDEPRGLTDPSLYINQELSWLSFNDRVLEEAEDPSHPLLDRVKFLAIVSTNTDEFFMIRVAGLKQARALGADRRGDDGLSPGEALAEVNRRVHLLSERQRRCLTTDLLPALARQGIHLLNYDQLDPTQRASLASFYQREIYPVLTPLAVDSGHRFPFISNLSLSLLVVIADGAGKRFARVKVPSSLPRLVPVEPGPRQPGSTDSGHQPVAFVWLEQVVAANVQSLFAGKEIVATFPFRVTRNADMEIQEDEASDLLESVTASLRLRPFGFVSRLTVDRSMPHEYCLWLAERLDVNPDDLYTLDGPLGLGELMGLLKLDRPDLRDPPLAPRVPVIPASGDGIFDILRRQDILLHHPYDSFAPVIDLVKAAARDPNVLAIKQTLYRVGQNSPIVESLQGARDDDTQVAVLVELKARFDEENNIGWAKALEAHGVHVAYGLPGLKTHCKVALVVRRDRDGVRRYCHLGTGNYNDQTARVYTDLGILTSRPEVGAEASEVFNYLTGYSDKRDYQTLLVSPINLRQRLTELIEREIAHAQSGVPARLIFKMNQLIDGEMIRALYRAAQAGVVVDLLVRGICCLRPGIPGISERTRVISIVGRFLEHSRIYYFRNGGDDEVYLGSADLMPRNLDRRVEVVFPVADPTLRAGVRDGLLEVQLRDTTKARALCADGSYVRLRPAPGEEPVDSQRWFMTHPTGTPLPATDRADNTDHAVAAGS
ncbi:MAG: polyphosphate kinase 1 [Chloroflexi bacterium]|nr:polyphosphate kinase 1 [Chloroflexota bacterium]